MPLENRDVAAASGFTRNGEIAEKAANGSQMGKREVDYEYAFQRSVKGDIHELAILYGWRDMMHVPVYPLIIPDCYIHLCCYFHRPLRRMNAHSHRRVRIDRR